MSVAETTAPVPVRREHSPAGLLRAGLLVLAGLGVVATAVELAMLRHWRSPSQLVPWLALGGIAVCLLAVALRPSRNTVLLARLAGASMVACGFFGALEHASNNYEAGPLDAVYGATWDQMNVVARWWHALTGSVGPAPTLAPLVLAQIGLCLLLATVQHPALQRSTTDA